MHYPKVLAIAVGILALALVGVALAQIPSPDGTIQGCFMTHDNPEENQGKVRVVSDPANCKMDETAISWNQQGPTGPAGPAGATGPAGPQGPQGPAGADGILGLEVVTETCQGPPGVCPNGTVEVVEGVGFYTATATCPVGKKVIAGGHESISDPFGSFVERSNHPTIDGTGWFMDVVGSPGDWILTVFAICATVN